MTQIDVAANPRDPTTFVVTLRDDDGSSTTHDVRIDPASASLAARYPSEATFVDACFRFLLEREPKESILRSFDVREIGRYFPRVGGRDPGRLAGHGGQRPARLIEA